MDWYKEFGYKHNPLEVNPLKNKEEPFGLFDEIDNLLYFVESDNCAIIKGESGSGKTLLLTQIIKKYGGKGRIIYIDGNRINKRFEFSKILMKKQSFMHRLLGKRPKNMILLIDNAKSLTPKAYKQIQYYFDQDYIKSIVFATEDLEALNMPQSFLDRIGKRVIELKPLSMDEAVELVLERLDQDIISKDKLEKIFILSDKNMTSFLKNVQKVLLYLAEEDENEDLELDINTINEIVTKEDDHDLEDDDENEDDEDSTDVCSDCNEKLVRIGNHYRCEECDLYCPECGVLIDPEDYECPSCGIKFEDDEDDNDEDQEDKYDDDEEEKKMKKGKKEKRGEK
jgi:ABC-type oligopeptide transport system ATPase subunit